MTDQIKITKTDAARAYKDIKTIAGFGNRSVGSEAEQRAADYMANEFAKVGCEVIRESFPATTFEEKEAWLAAKLPIGRVVGKAMYFSSGSPLSGIEAELIYVSFGREDDYQGIDVKGKIVIIERDPEYWKDYFWKEATTASQHGAVGLILVNDNRWVSITTLETGLFEPTKRLLPILPDSIPALVVSGTDGGKLLYAAKNFKTNVQLIINTVISEGLSENVRAIIPGHKSEEKKILVYAHRDSVGCPGANDNGSGCAILLEIARALSDIRLNRTIELISLGATEIYGSAGAEDYLKRHSDTLWRIAAGIEIDTVGSGSNLSVMQGGDWPDTKIRYPETLCDFVAATASEQGYHMGKSICSFGTPDSGRFQTAGIASTWIWDGTDAYCHSPEDTPDKIDPNKLKIVADIAGTCIARLAMHKKSVWQ